ncbi:MAG TPA: aldehyde ferredoxin oxidoreductase family protein [Thermoplasmata archaeon]|nr:aldehyde ferredoxin oxidoreductase family protein [Thermoplasmata archaeon]
MLNVDLDSGAIQPEERGPEYWERYIGGRGVGAKLLSEEDFRLDPYHPRMPVFFCTSPYEGTIASCNRTWVVTVSPLTGYYSCAAGGGFWGPTLRKAGYDVVRVVGKSDRPVYVEIRNGKAEIKDASHLWGLNVEQTREKLKAAGRALCIGPSGENLVRLAGVALEDRFAARGGLGAVLGAKKLKAITVFGTMDFPGLQGEPIKVFHKKTLAQNKERSDYFHEQGTMEIPPKVNEGNLWPTHNWQDVKWEQGENLYFPKFLNILTGYTTCFDCSIRCTRTNTSRYGDQGRGPEYETTWAFGPQVMNDDPDIVVHANKLCDEYGLDTISVGSTLGFYRECIERGLVQDTWPTNEKMFELIEAIAHRKGVGDILAEGTLRASQVFDGQSQDFAIQQCGMELPAYDPRGSWGMFLCYVFGPRHGCHNKAWTVYMELGMSLDARTGPVGKAKLVSDLLDETAVIDSIGICTLVTPIVFTETPEAYNTILGKEATEQDMRRIARGITDLERHLDTERGHTREKDALPKRLIDSEVDVNGKRVHLGEATWDRLRSEYYRYRGWSAEGVPNLVVAQ